MEAREHIEIVIDDWNLIVVSNNLKCIGYHVTPVNVQEIPATSTRINYGYVRWNGSTKQLYIP